MVNYFLLFFKSKVVVHLFLFKQTFFLFLINLLKTLLSFALALNFEDDANR